MIINNINQFKIGHLYFIGKILPYYSLSTNKERTITFKNKILHDGFISHDAIENKNNKSLCLYTDNYYNDEFMYIFYLINEKKLYSISNLELQYHISYNTITQLI